MATIEYELSRRKREVATDYRIAIDLLHTARVQTESGREAQMLSLCIDLLEAASRLAQSSVR